MNNYDYIVELNLPDGSVKVVRTQVKNITDSVTARRSIIAKHMAQGVAVKKIEQIFTESGHPDLGNVS